ncbi:hypothetical protein, partial [Paenibacillus apiarius]|uniref:hypothetical protein n=1 Tax=Paenibacillus apiarius TaxID=46240 RepID=UPI003B3A323A
TFLGLPHRKEQLLLMVEDLRFLLQGFFLEIPLRKGFLDLMLLVFLPLQPQPLGNFNLGRKPSRGRTFVPQVGKSLIIAIYFTLLLRLLLMAVCSLQFLERKLMKTLANGTIL